MSASTTRGARRRRADAPDEAEPGLLLVFSVDKPLLVPLQCGAEPLVLGRDSFVSSGPADPVMSRQHVRISRRGDSWSVRDLESRNGTFVDGDRVAGEWLGPRPRVLFVGESLLVTVDDLAPFRGAGVSVSADQVVGPKSAQLLERIAKAAGVGNNLHILGESGSGKELAARAFHGSSTRPFVPVNCAAVPEALAERLFFGSKKGVYSDATEAPGYLQAASGGTLFLDEVAELPLAVQAKLLRVLETGELLPLGATATQRIDLRVVTASHRPLADEVAAGRFRQDSFYRIARPSVEVPPLRERIEEIPFLIQQGLARLKAKPRLHASFVEACLLRPWPGNVRELLRELRSAVSEAGDSEFLESEHLDAAAGLTLGARPARAAAVDDAAIEAALLRTKVISQAARELGMHRTQVQRWLANHPEVAALIRRPAK